MNDSVLITGAGSGIGLACSLELAEHGFRVYASIPADDQAPAVRQAADRRGVELQILSLDVTDADSIRAAVDRIVAECQIYGVIHSAGLGMRGFFEDLTQEEIERVFDVNVFGTMAVTRAVLPSMRKAGRGRVVMVTSAGGRIGAMTISGYGSGKFALEGFGESLAIELAPHNIQLSLVEPGLVLTPHFTQHRGRARGAVNPDSPYFAWFAQHEHMVDGILKKGRITPADVARTVHRALSARRPRLRYPVGIGPRLMFGLRRYLPERWFERLYFGRIIKSITEPKHPVTELSELVLPGDEPT